MLMHGAMSPFSNLTDYLYNVTHGLTGKQMKTVKSGI